MGDDDYRMIADTMTVYVRHEYMKFFSLDFAPDYLVFESFKAELEHELGARLCLLRPNHFSVHPFPVEEQVLEAIPTFGTEGESSDEDPESPEE